MKANLNLEIERRIAVIGRSKNLNKQVQAVDELGELFERAISNHTAIDAMLLRRAAKMILHLIISQDEGQLRESLLHALVSASSLACAKGDHIDFSSMVSDIDRFSDAELEHVLFVLGFTHQRGFLPIVERFLNHSNSHLRDVAGQARRELMSNQCAT